MDPTFSLRDVDSNDVISRVVRLLLNTRNFKLHGRSVAPRERERERALPWYQSSNPCFKSHYSGLCWDLLSRLMYNCKRLEAPSYTSRHEKNSPWLLRALPSVSLVLPKALLKGLELDVNLCDAESG